MESTRTALTSPRRIAIAIGLAALLSGGSIGLLGMADAADQPPSMWSIPAPHDGDVAQYHNQAPNTDRISRTFTWSLEQSRAINGTVFPAAAIHRLEERIDQDGETTFWESVFHVALGSQQPLRYSIETSRGTAGGGTTLPVDPFASSMTGWGSRIFFPLEPVAPCGFAPPFLGSPAAIDKPLHLPGCGDAPFFYSVETVEEQDRVVLSNLAGTQQIYYAPNLPVPTRLVLINEFGSAQDWVLSGFERGSTELPPAGQGTPQARPTPTMAPTTRWGPDSSDFPVDYSAESALEDVRNESNGESQVLEQFMARHPDWWLGTAEYSDTTSENGRTWGWNLRLASPTESLGVLSYRFQRPAEGPEPFFPAPEREYLTKVFEPSSEQLYPAMPDVLPSAGSALQTWADDASRPAANATGWFFDLDCDMICRDGGFVIGAGDGVEPNYHVATSGALVDFVPLPEQNSGDGQALAIDEHGELVGGYGFRWTTKEGLEPIALAADSGGPIQIAPAPGGWIAPPASVAAAAGVLGILVALAYYLWPAAKHGAFLGLRIRRGGAAPLDHPVRRSLYDHIVAEPGIHYQSLVRKSGRGNGAVDHHLAFLSKAGMVRKTSSLGYTCYTAQGQTPVTAAAGPALRADGAKRIFQEIRAHPGLGVTEVAQNTELSPGTVSHHLRRMREAGIVTSIREGKTVRLYVREDVHVATGPATDAS